MINIDDRIKTVNNLDQIDQYDDDEYDGDDFYSEGDEWEGDGMSSGGLSPDTIVKEYKGNAIVAQEAVYLCAPRFGDAEQIIISE